MANMYVNNYEDPAMPSHSLFSVPEGIDESMSLIHSTVNSMLNNSPTYTALEPLYPEATQASSNLQFLANLDSSHANLQTIFTYSPNSPASYTDLPLRHPILHKNLTKDEGLGSSSPSSQSSCSPPLIHGQALAHGQTISPGTSSNYDCSHRSSSSSPSSTMSSNYSTAPECSNCGNRYGIVWYSTHFLCRQCMPQKPIVVNPPTVLPDQANGGKRKRSSTCTRNLNQVCTNCESTRSQLWRRSVSTGDTVCNACGLYEKLHNFPRPKSMRKDTIQTRKRKPKASGSPKSKKTSKKSPKKLQENTVVPPVEQQQYIPNAVQFSLPAYQDLQVRNLHSNFNAHHSSMMASHQSFYVNYRPEIQHQDIYNPVPPNDIINLSPSIPPTTMSSTFHFTNSQS